MKTIIRISTILFIALTMCSACKSDQEKLADELWDIIPNGTVIYEATSFTVQQGNATPQNGYFATNNDLVSLGVIKNYPLTVILRRRIKGSFEIKNAAILKIDFSDFSKNGDSYVSKWTKVTGEESTTVTSNEAQVIFINYGSYIKVSYTQVAIDRGIPFTVRIDFKSRLI